MSDPSPGNVCTGPPQVWYLTRMVLPPPFLYGTHLVRDPLVLVQKHAELADTDPHVTDGELVRDVETQCSELSPLQSDAVKQAQREQEVFELFNLDTGATNTT